MRDKIKAGIVGATGYTGSELVRILNFHPRVNLEIITSESRKGEAFSDVHPQFNAICEIRLESIEDIGKYDLDVVFLALPHGVSMDFVKKYSDADFRIIDLSGDFRLSGKDAYESWYKKEHIYPAGFESAVFGLPELYREQIKKARLVANPGCFPTSAILALAPLIKEGIIDKDRIVIDSKTGVTGAGIKAKDVTHFPNVNDNFKAYGIKTHRHTIEIQEILNEYGRTDGTVLFTPHLLPVDRGILSSTYSRPLREISEDDLQEIYRNYYSEEPFVRIRKEAPAIKQVRGTNYCDIFATYDVRTDTIIAMAAIDNLVKGAAGQAVQNMNLMMSFNEREGLEIIPLQP